jgi:hypothetical protein
MIHWSIAGPARRSTRLHAPFATRVTSPHDRHDRTGARPPRCLAARLAPAAARLPGRRAPPPRRRGDPGGGALTAVGFFADRINGGLERDARQILGGDAILSSDQPAPDLFAARARAAGLLTATTASFPSMGRAPDASGGATRLVSVKAVSDAYPLRGKLRLREAATGARPTSPEPRRRARHGSTRPCWMRSASTSAPTCS